MSSDGSITRWIGELKAGDDTAARELWDRYFDRLVRLARGKLHGTRRDGAGRDEEDVALSALDSVFRRAAGDGLPRLDDREALWRLLVVVTARKALNSVRDARRKKRGGDRVRLEADLAVGGAGEDVEAALAQVIGPEPTPEFAAMVAEEYRHRLAALGDEELRRVAVWRMDGHDLEEIAAKLGCGTRTVKRKLSRIRQAWSEANRT